MFKTIINNFHLEKLIWIIKSKLKYMIFFALICGALAGGVAYVTRSDVYAAQISLYVYSNPDYINDNGINLSAGDLTQASSLLSSYTQILKSDGFLRLVIEEAELDPLYYTVERLRANITSQAVSGTAVFRVTVRDPNPYNAMTIANTIGKLAPDKIISIVKAGGIEILDEAVLPTTPYESTSVFLMILIGCFGGGVLSALFFIYRGLMNTTYRRTYEVEDMFNIPIVGMVPQITDKRENGENDVLLRPDSPFILREAYNDIRANLLFIGKGEKCPVFAVTGADYDEGKTTNAINIAKIFAMMGKKTLLIDADLRNGNVGEELGIKDSKGVSEYLAELAALNIHKDVDTNLDLITTGAFPPNPTDLLISDRWKKLIADMKEKYDVIILDTPSIGIVSDGIEVVNVATAYVVVIRENLTRFEREELIIRKLEAVDANICGFVYNGISVKSEDYNHKEYINGGEYGKRNIGKRRRASVQH